jgi:hypothetical protein
MATTTDPTDRNLSRLAAEAASSTPLFRGLLGHHINNALTVVIADLQFALQHTSDDEARAALEEALDAARRIGTIVVTVKGDTAKSETPSPTMVAVEARLVEAHGPRASLHVARPEGRTWLAWVTASSGIAETAEGSSIGAAVVSLLWPERVRP